MYIQEDLIKILISNVNTFILRMTEKCISWDFKDFGHGRSDNDSTTRNRTIIPQFSNNFRIASVGF